MDVFAHALWGYAVFRKRTLTKWTVAMSVMPDLLSFGIYLFILFITGNFIFGGPHGGSIPNYVTFMYSLTHSLFIAGIFAIFVYLKFRKYLILVGAWMMHIVIDIFTHTEEFFPTPFLYPVSDFHLSVISWGTPWFMIANYSALAIVYSALGFRWLRKMKT
ncbi:MAG: hypothetical protein ABIH63_04290 [archaeon]